MFSLGYLQMEVVKTTMIINLKKLCDKNRMNSFSILIVMLLFTWGERQDICIKTLIYLCKVRLLMFWFRYLKLQGRVRRNLRRAAGSSISIFRGTCQDTHLSLLHCRHTNFPCFDHWSCGPTGSLTIPFRAPSQNIDWCAMCNKIDALKIGA